jgi:uncharacterized membrane protein
MNTNGNIIDFEQRREAWRQTGALTESKGAAAYVQRRLPLERGSGIPAQHIADRLAGLRDLEMMARGCLRSAVIEGDRDTAERAKAILLFILESGGSPPSHGRVV